MAELFFSKQKYTMNTKVKITKQKEAQIKFKNYKPSLYNTHTNQIKNKPEIRTVYPYMGPIIVLTLPGVGFLWVFKGGGWGAGRPFFLNRLYSSSSVLNGVESW